MYPAECNSGVTVTSSHPILSRILRSYSTKLQAFTCNFPTEVNRYNENYLIFTVHNFSKKSGSYKLDVSSDNFLVMIDSAPKPEYARERSLSALIKSGEEHSWKIHIKTDELTLPPDAGIELNFLNTSSFLLKEKHTWNLSYMRVDSRYYQKYHFSKKNLSMGNFLMFGSKALF